MEIEKKRRKKNRHVLAQNGIAFILLLISIVTITIIFVFFMAAVQIINDEGTFLYGNQRSVADELAKVESYPWLVETWKEHYLEYDRTLELSSREFMDSLTFIDEHGGYTFAGFPIDAVQELSPEEQEEFARITYRWLLNALSEYNSFLDYSGSKGPVILYWDGSVGRVLMNSDDEPTLAVGSVINDDLGDPVNLPEYIMTEDIISGPLAIDSIFTFADDQKKINYAVLTRASSVEESTYIMTYVPTDKLQKHPLRYVRETLGGELLAIVLACGIFMVIFYLITVHPLRKVQDGLQKYTDTKDTDKLLKDMEKVRARNEIGRLSDDICDMATELREYSVALEKQARTATELKLATEIQLSMLPDKFPTAEEEKRFEIYASMKPAKEVGGDLYDFFFADDDHLVLVVGDVSGKGIPAALFMMMAKTMIKDKTLPGHKPGEIIKEINEGFIENNRAELFITIWFMVVELSTGRCIEVNAGHMNPVLMRCGRDYEMVRYNHSMVVGVMEGMEYAEREWELKPGDRLFVYSDGVTEAEDQNETQFGNDRLVEVLNGMKDKSQKEILEELGRILTDFSGEDNQFDDITMLGFTYFGAEKE